MVTIIWYGCERNSIGYADTMYAGYATGYVTYHAWQDRTLNNIRGLVNLHGDRP